jgi:hypothetical protein
LAAGPDAPGKVFGVKGLYIFNAPEAGGIVPGEAFKAAEKKKIPGKRGGLFKAAFDNRKYVFGADIIVPVQRTHKLDFFFMT